MGRDNFSEEVKRTLAERVGGHCSNPECACDTFGPDPDDHSKRTSIGEAAHITAAAQGGPRYDANMSASERSSIANGIWLCRNCARLIDEQSSKYDVYTLKGWKEDAEEKQMKRLGKSDKANHIKRYPDTYFTLDTDDDLVIRYCTRCYEVDNKLVQLMCYNGRYECPNCKNNGIYDMDKALAHYKATHPGRRIISKGIDCNWF